MKVVVKFTATLRGLTKTDRTCVVLAENTHLSALLDVLTKRYGDALIAQLYLSERGTRDVWASVIVDGTVVPLPLAPQADLLLRDGSVVVIMSPVSGG